MRKMAMTFRPLLSSEPTWPRNWEPCWTGERRLVSHPRVLLPQPPRFWDYNLMSQTQQKKKESKLVVKLLLPKLSSLVWCFLSLSSIAIAEVWKKSQKMQQAANVQQAAKEEDGESLECRSVLPCREAPVCLWSAALLAFAVPTL